MCKSKGLPCWRSPTAAPAQSLVWGPTEDEATAQVLLKDLTFSVKRVENWLQMLLVSALEHQ